MREGGFRMVNNSAFRIGGITAFTLAAHGLTAVAVIWLFYSFRYTGFAIGIPTAAHFALT